MLTETKYCLALGALVFRKDLLEAATGDLKKKKKESSSLLRIGTTQTRSSGIECTDL